jgi:prepilin-type N-terminal cleavage/methylation domain-containing protein
VTWSSKRAGFTLVELLVAMLILVVIVLITTRIFQQATMSWDVGLKKAEMSMTGRAVVDCMAQEIGQAVEDRTLYAGVFDVQPKQVDFVVLAVPTNGTAPRAQQVEFRVEEGIDGARVVRVWRDFDYETRRWAPSWQPMDPAPLAEGLPVPQPVEVFKADGTWDGQGLPRYVDVEIRVADERDMARAKALGQQPVTRSYQSRAYFCNRKRYVMD